MTARITYVGHATVLIELDGVRLLTDPALRRRMLGVIERASEPPASEDIGALDAVLVSHLHPDHLDFASLRSLDGTPEMVIPAGSGPLLRRRGADRVTEVEPGDSVAVGGVRITATPAIHDGRRFKLGPAIPALGFVAEGAGRRVYFAGDTDVFDGMRDIGALGIDVALLPIGGWGPKVGSGHLDAERAGEAATLLRPRAIVPVHWGTYLRSDLHRRRPELLTDPPRRLAEVLAKRAPGVDLHVLAPGESWALAEPAV